MKKKKLILSLIKDDLINSKLVYSLDEMGLNADNYLLHLSGTIFNLIGFAESAQTDELTDQYVSMTSRVKQVDAEEMHDELNLLAQEIYSELLMIKNGQAA